MSTLAAHTTYMIKVCSRFLAGCRSYHWRHVLEQNYTGDPMCNMMLQCAMVAEQNGRLIRACMWQRDRFLFFSWATFHKPWRVQLSNLSSILVKKKKQKNKRKIVSQVKSAQTLNIDLYKYNLQSLFSNLNRFFILLWFDQVTNLFIESVEYFFTSLLLCLLY